MSRFLIIPLLAGLLATATPALADDHRHARRWHGEGKHLRHERRVEHHAWRQTWRRLERAEHRGERRAWRQWRRSHRPGRHHEERYLRHHRPHGHLYRPHVRYRPHGVSHFDPLPVIGGGVLGGVVGNALGDGDPLATTTGLFIGSVVGYELGRH